MTNLTNADEIEIVDVTADGDEYDGIDAGRWTNYGKDRLYINDGIQKADKYDLHVDLQSNEVVSDNEHKHGGSVEVEGDTAVITIEDKGALASDEYVITLAVDWTSDDEDEGDEDDERAKSTEEVLDQFL